VVAANQANFLDDGAATLPVLGGLREISDAQADLLRSRAAATLADSQAKAKELQARLVASNKAASAKIAADQTAALKAADARSGGLLGDLKAIGKGVATGVGDAAKVVGAVAAVVPGGQVVGAVLVGAGSALKAAAKGDVKGAVTGAVTAAAPAAGGVVSAARSVAAPVVDAVKAASSVAAPVVAAVKSAAPIAQTLAAAPVVDQLAKGANVAASALVSVLPASLVYDAAHVDGIKVVADKLLAAREAGGAAGAAAQKIIGETAKLSLTSTDTKVRASAKQAIIVLGQVTRARADAGIAPGVEQLVSTAGAKAAAAYVSGTLGMQVALPAGVTVRSEQPTNAFASVPTQAASATRATAPTSSAPAAVATAPSAAPAAAVETPAPELGFVVTSDARILQGTAWFADAGGVLGVLVRATGPVSLRRDATVRGWRAA
jgi:hypothetical protein